MYPAIYSSEMGIFWLYSPHRVLSICKSLTGDVVDLQHVVLSQKQAATLAIHCYMKCSKNIQKL